MLSAYQRRHAEWRERLADTERTVAKRRPRGERRRLVKVYKAPGYPTK